MDWYMIFGIVEGFLIATFSYTPEATKQKNIVGAIIGCAFLILINMGIWYFRLLGWL